MPTEFPRLRKQFLKRFAEELAPLGFKKSDQFYYRRTFYGKDIIHATFVAHPGHHFEVNLSIGVRHDAVENIVLEFLTDYPKDLVTWSVTVGNRLDNLLLDFNTIEDIINKSVSWVISDENDLEEELQSIMRMVHDFILPYFQRFSSLEETLNVLSANDRESTRHHSRSAGWGAMDAVAAAFVRGDRNRFEEVVEQKIQYLAQIPLPNPQIDKLMPVFRALVENLRRRWDVKEPCLKEIN